MALVSGSLDDDFFVVVNNTNPLGRQAFFWHADRTCNEEQYDIYWQAMFDRNWKMVPLIKVVHTNEQSLTPTRFAVSACKIRLDGSNVPAESVRVVKRDGLLEMIYRCNTKDCTICASTPTSKSLARTRLAGCAQVAHLHGEPGLDYTGSED